MLVLLPLAIVLLAGCGESPANSTQPTSNQVPTPTPSPASATTTAGVQVTHGRPVLGSPLSDFVGAYGQCTVMNPSMAPDFYDFDHHTIDITAYKEDNYLASDVLYSNVDGKGWNNLEEA